MPEIRGRTVRWWPPSWNGEIVELDTTLELAPGLAPARIALASAVGDPQVGEYGAEGEMPPVPIPPLVDLSDVTDTESASSG